MGSAVMNSEKKIIEHTAYLKCQIAPSSLSLFKGMLFSFILICFDFAQ